MNRKLLAILLTISAFAFTACGTTDPGNNDGSGSAVCGNNKKETNEACDGTDLNSKTCASVDTKFTGGTLKCSSTCTFDTSGCTTKNTPTNPSNNSTTSKTCGNGNLDAGEECDGNNFAEKKKTCAAVTGDANATGTLSCTDQCKVDKTNCKTSSTTPQKELNCTEKYTWFGQDGLNGPALAGEYGTFDDSTGIKEIIDQLKSVPAGEKKEITLTTPLEVNDATVIASSRRGKFGYVQDKDGALLIRLMNGPENRFHPGKKVSFKATKISRYYGNYQVNEISDFSEGGDSTIKAIDLNEATSPVSIDTDPSKFVTFQGTITGEIVGIKDKCGAGFLCYTFKAFNDASKVYEFRINNGINKNKALIANDKCIFYAGPVNFYKGKVQLNADNFDWVKIAK